MLSADLRQKIDALWKKFWANGMADHMDALKHISYLIFMKKLEDYENDRIIGGKQSNKKYESIFDGHDEMRWSEWRNYSGEKMLLHVKNKVFPFLKDLKKYGGYKLDLENSNFIIESPILLEDAVQVIDDLKISKQNLDTQGDIYEYVTSQLKTAGLNGAFRTPRHIIQMMIEMLDPDVNQKICDPACGTGGFLVNSYLHILKKYNSKESNDAQRSIGDNLTKMQRDFLLNEQFFGFDYSKSMIQFSQMNMILHGFKQPRIKYQNSVGKEFNQDEEYDIILANPPFSGKLNKSEINEDFDVNTTKTELLFLELFYNKLAIGGQAAVIVPISVLFTDSTKANIEMRKLLLKKCQIDMIIYLPPGIFRPYAGETTAILFFTKGGETKNVWIYRLEADGFKLDSNHNIPVEENDIPDILKKYKEKQISDKSKIITIKEIETAGYNLSISNYMDISKKQKKVNFKQTIQKIDDLKNKITKYEKLVKKDLDDLGL
jgi:type I restriction enzyme M protein